MPEVERNLARKEEEEPKKNGNNDKKKANESSDKKKEEKIILNYLCCLVYDGCGIRCGASINTLTAFQAHAKRQCTKCCKVSNIV